MIAALKTADCTLRQRSAGLDTLERVFVRVLRRFFREQGQRVAETVARYGGAFDGLAELVFDIQGEHELFMNIAMPRLGEMMAFGAMLAGEPRKQFEQGDMTEFLALWDLPSEVVASIGEYLHELATQPYWIKLQEFAQADVANIIREGMEGGWSTYKMGMQIREHFGGMAGNQRAQMIARTESTASANAGQQSQINAAEAEGLFVVKTWVTAGDADVRGSHQMMNGTTVRGQELFDLDGWLVPFPGHWSLPGAHRVRCRCTVFADVI